MTEAVTPAHPGLVGPAETEPEPVAVSTAAAAPQEAPLPAPRAKPRAAKPVREAGDTPWSDRFAFLVATTLQASSATLEALGLGHPARIPFVLVIWLVTTIFLGLPTVHLADPSWQEMLRYGNWTKAGWLAAFVEVCGLFIYQVLRSGPTVAKARKQVPQLGIQALVAGGEALYWTEVRSADELKDWMERVKAWTGQCERELTETISAAAADGFRRPSVIQVYQHRQRFNEAHNGWLDLLSKRLDALRSLSQGLKPKSTRFVQDPTAPR